MKGQKTSSMLDRFAVETFRGITADTEDVELSGTDGNDSWVVLGAVTARNGYDVNIDLKEGDDSLRVLGNVEALAGSSTSLALNGGNNSVSISGNMKAQGNTDDYYESASNTITSTGGNDTINIGGYMEATNGGRNDISLSGSGNSVRIEKGLMNDDDSSNYISISDETGSPSEGSNSITIGGDITGSDNAFTIIQMSSGSENTLTVEGDYTGSTSLNMGGTDKNTFTVEGDMLLGYSTNSIGFRGKELVMDIGGKFGYENEGFTYFNADNEKMQMNFHGGIVAHGGEHYMSIRSDDAGIMIGGMSAIDGGTTLIVSGYEEPIRSRIDIQGDVYAGGEYGKNEINIYSGDTSLFIAGAVESAEGGSNRIQVQDETDSSIFIGGDVIATDGGRNEISGDGEITIEGKLLVQGEAAENPYEESNRNEIEISSSDSVFTLKGGMEASAENGLNSIKDSGEDNIFYLSGEYSATGLGAENRVDAGYGNDQVFLDGQVAVGGLNLLGGEGYDALTLGAADGAAMAANYQGWLEAAAANTGDSGFAEWGWESLRVDLADTQTDLSSLQWLGDMVQSHNSGTASPIDLELNVEGYGQALNLGDFFSGRDDDIFTAINLGGEAENTLVVDGSLFSNDINEFMFKVHGDVADTVQLSNDWFAIGDAPGSDGAPDYTYYTTGYDLLMIQSEINVVFGA